MVLTMHETETIRAALQFWLDEIAPHGEAAARPYLESSEARLLCEQEVENLRERFTQALLRYAVLEPGCEKLTDVELYGTSEEAGAVAGPARVATVLLPPD